MKIFIYLMALQLFIKLSSVNGAAIICEEKKASKTNEETVDKLSHNTSSHHLQHNSHKQHYNETNKLNKFLHKIQCSLEKAKPWIDELEQETKRLEEAAKILGIGILNSFGDFINKLSEDGPPLGQTSGMNVTASTEEVTTEEIPVILCPDGFVADYNGICERI
uniref:Uncharacterized protein n=1 Tax=Stomoxys calcitrans TaxID=35570 RepID=A0A1I8NTB6_STOCA